MVLKDVWVSKFKRVYVFVFFEYFEHMDPFLWNIYLKKFDLKKNWNKRTTCPHVFLECFKHITFFLKHSEFSWKFCTCIFESIRIYFKILTIFWHIVLPWWFFKKLNLKRKKIVHTFCGSLFHAFTHMVLKFTFFSILKFIPP